MNGYLVASNAKKSLMKMTFEKRPLDLDAKIKVIENLGQGY